MRVMLLQIDVGWESPAANRAVIERMLSDASPPPGAFVLSPEMAETGFVPNLPECEDGRGEEFASTLARRFGVWFQHGCLSRHKDGFGRNMAVVAAPDGSIIARYAKIHPFGYGSETRGFRGGGALAPFDVIEPATGTSVRCAPFVCYDLRFPEVWRLAVLAGVEMFAIGANWPSARRDAWRALCIARAIENQAFVLGCNRVGRDPSVEYSGGSLIVSPVGQVLAEARDSACALQATLDFQLLRRWRDEFPALGDMRRRFLGRIPMVRCDSAEARDRGH